MTALIFVSAALAASATEACLVRIEVSMALIGLFASTAAQPVAFGVNPEPAAASEAWIFSVTFAGVSGMLAAYCFRLGIQPSPTMRFWPAGLESWATQSMAAAAFLEFLAMPMTEPPRKTGTVLPSVALGIGAAPT